MLWLMILVIVQAMEMEQESVINRMMDAFLDKCQQQMETPNTIGAQLGLIQDKKLSQRRK